MNVGHHSFLDSMVVQGFLVKVCLAANKYYTFQ